MCWLRDPQRDFSQLTSVEGSLRPLRVWQDSASGLVLQLPVAKSYCRQCVRGLWIGYKLRLL